MNNSIVYKHWISMAHRLAGHVGPCGRLHGHNYLIEIELRGHALNKSGMIIDFSEVKKLLGAWLDANWDHKLMLAQDDPIIAASKEAHDILKEFGLITVPYSPTAENMACALMRTFNEILAAQVPMVWVSTITVHETATGSAKSCNYRMQSRES